jgi:transposase-like protein
MATFEITIDDEKNQDLLQGDRGMAALLEPILNHLLQAKMTKHLRAEPGERTDQRRGWRNGSYERQLTTRVGTLELEVPRDREGTVQTALFERYQHVQKSLRVKKALVLALMQMVVQGVSTGRVKKITAELCGREFSRQTVPRLAEGLDEHVEAWAERSLDAREYPFLVLDGMQRGDDTSPTVRRQGAVRSTTVLLAVGISDQGQREILGLDVAFGETGEAWRRFIDRLKALGLSGVVAQKFLRSTTSDAHEGLRQALEAAFPELIWQRCQAHFRRNVLDRTPAGLRDRMHELLDRVLTAPSPERAREAFGEACAELEGQADKALEVLETGWEEATAVLALPTKYRRRLRTTNMLERFIEEIRRREKVVRIFHRRNSCVRSRPTVSSGRSAPSGMRSGLRAGATSRWTHSTNGKRLSNPTTIRYRQPLEPTTWQNAFYTQPVT